MKTIKENRRWTGNTISSAVGFHLTLCLALDLTPAGHK